MHTLLPDMQFFQHIFLTRNVGVGSLCPRLPVVPRCQVMRRYHIQDRDDYRKYNKICGLVTQLTNVLKQLDPQDKLRIELTEQLLTK